MHPHASPFVGVVAATVGEPDLVRVPVPAVVVALRHVVVREVGRAPLPATDGAAHAAAPHCHVLPVSPRNLRPELQGLVAFLREVFVELRPRLHGHEDGVELPVVGVREHGPGHLRGGLRVACDHAGPVAQLGDGLEVAQLATVERPMVNGTLDVLPPRALLAFDQLPASHLDGALAADARPVAQRLAEHPRGVPGRAPRRELRRHGAARPSGRARAPREVRRQTCKRGLGLRQHRRCAAEIFLRAAAVLLRATEGDDMDGRSGVATVKVVSIKERGGGQENEINTSLQGMAWHRVDCDRSSNTTLDFETLAFA
mmetsp:Transcript_29510/g.84129  ORF Transcript_29510/g.84129 Transcript_29510/m.84129 type:complete len:314 (-) Transcript_29510:6-947(-)